MRISRELGVTLDLAFDEAKRRRHEFLCLEHVLYALLFDEVVANIIRHCAGDVEALKRELEVFFSNNMEQLPEGSEVEPQQTVGFQRVVQRAAAHVQSAGKEEISGRDIFVALFREQDSHAVYLMEQQGITRLDVINYISHGVSKIPEEEEPAFDGDESAGEESEERPVKNPLEAFTVNLTAKSLFETWAEQQGMTRPFEALCQMDAAARGQVAETLKVDLSNAWEDGLRQAKYDLGVSADESEDGLELPFDPDLPCDNDQAEACLVIGRDGYGIQARSHSTLETLDLFAENHTWGEVLISVIEEFKIPCRVAGKSEEELESAIFDYCAEQEWKQKDERERQEIEKFINQQPELIDKLKAAGFDTKKRRWVVNLMFQAAKRGGFGTYITAVKAAAWMNRTLGTKIMMKTATHGLKVALRAFNVALWAWLVWDVLAFFFGPSRKRLIPVIALIHQHYLLEKLDL